MFLKRSEVLLERGDWEGAAAELRAAGDEASLGRLAAGLAERGQLADAEAALRAALERAPRSSARLHAALGDVLRGGRKDFQVGLGAASGSLFS